MRKIVNLILQCLLAIFIMTLINGLTPLIGL
ncbi:CPBP family intramembrane metalloprotease, partial [Staphylococcus epidermidis]|nr:CPBP family intramembrane metalloprotease [Staphylococcus epidermidis]